MLEWKGALWAGICVTGIGLFLKAVADELDRVERNLRVLEQAQQRAYAKRRAAQALDQ